MTLATDESAPAGRWRRECVLVVEDHALVAHGLTLMLRGRGLDAVTTSDPDVDAVLALARRHRPSLAIVDLQFDGSPRRGAALIEPLAALGTPVLVVTAIVDRAELGECLEAGAAGVASKSEDFDLLMERVEAVLRDEPANTLREREDLLAAVRARRADEWVRLSPFRALSSREAEVLSLLVDGLPADAIARELYVSVPTVRSHIQAVLRKLDVTSQLAAVARARAAGWSLTATPHD